MPCTPSPCGPNSMCREVNDQAVCSCLPSYLGSPPSCRPECVVSSDCSLDKACTNLHCMDPCPGSCGLNSQCVVINHNPICKCPVRYTGDPFTRCYPIRKLYFSTYIIANFNKNNSWTWLIWIFSWDSTSPCSSYKPLCSITLWAFLRMQTTGE